MKTTALSLLSIVCAAEAFTPSARSGTSTKLASTSADEAAMDELKAIAVAANPSVKYYDPLNLVDAPICDSKAGSIAWLRHAELKHGRVAMAAFVGYCVQSKGITWNFPDTFPQNVGGPEAQWDALSENLKWYVILTVGFLEIIDEADTKGHYVTGKKTPGMHPVFARDQSKLSEESQMKARVKEINNGRLAMLGIMGFVSASSVPGSVPILAGKIPEYTGNFWAPFASDFSLLN